MQQCRHYSVNTAITRCRQIRPAPHHGPALAQSGGWNQSTDSCNQDRVEFPRNLHGSARTGFSVPGRLKIRAVLQSWAECPRSKCLKLNCPVENSAVGGKRDICSASNFDMMDVNFSTDEMITVDKVIALERALDLRHPEN
jgi:hypothetical protein